MITAFGLILVKAATQRRALNVDKEEMKMDWRVNKIEKEEWNVS